jgi:hypothetical protein
VLAPSIALHSYALLWTRPLKAVTQGFVAVVVAGLFYAPALLRHDALGKVGPLRADAAHRHVFSLFTLAKGALKALHASEPQLSAAYFCYVWGGRALVLALLVAILWRLRSLDEVAHASFLVLLGLISTTAVFCPWYLTWILPFAAVQADRTTQPAALGLTVLAAPLMGIPWAWLGLPLIQLAGLVTIAAWVRGGRILNRTP